MGVTPEELSEHYPLLYHMADRRSWESIQRRGLLSTDALVALFDVPDENRPAILRQQRTESVVIEHPNYGQAVIRDQKPLIRSRLESCLEGCSFQEWLNMLNSRVFFWLSTARLQTLMCARTYCADEHVVLTLDTLRVATEFSQSITLAPMNTGNTRPIAHKRGLQTFSRLADYPFQSRLKRHLEGVVELAVEGGIRNVMDLVIEAAIMRCSNCEKSEAQHIETIRHLYSSVS